MAREDVYDGECNFLICSLMVSKFFLFVIFLLWDFVLYIWTSF